MIPFATISPSRRSFADPHSRQSCRRNHRLPIPIRDDLAVATIVCRSPFVTILPNCSPSPSLLLAVVAFTVVAFARRHRWSSPSSLKLDRRRRSNPSDISAPSHIDASAPFCQFSSHGPSTSTYTDCLPSLRHFKPQWPFGFHFNRWPFTFPSNIFFFFLTTSSMRLLKLYLFIAFLQSAILYTHTYKDLYISLIVFICLNCCFCKKVRWVCVVFVCGQVLDGVLSYDDDNHFMKRNVYWFGDGEFY